MTFLDILLFPIYFGIFYFLAGRTVNKNKAEPIYGLYYMRGLNYKIFGSISFVLIYTYYYNGGDTYAYFWAASALIKLLFSDPGLFFKFVLGVYPRYPDVLAWDLIQHGTFYITRGSATLTTIRIAGVFNVICLNSFLCTSMLFAFISYQYSWKLFRLMASIYPTLHKQLAVAFLMIPSALFWCSGLSKDTIMFTSIAAFIYYFYLAAIRKQLSPINIIALLFFGYIMALIRGFILFILLPCLLLMTVVYYRNQIRSSFVRFLIGPLFIAAGVGASVLVVRSLGQSVESYQLDTLEKKAEGFKSWHTTLGETRGGSSYNLGSDFSFTAGGIASKTPIAIVTTLFGPFIWQVRSPVMLLSAIESLTLLYFTLNILFTRKIYKLLGILMRDHIVVMCVPIVLILAVAIGMTSFNYGAMVRYRTPILPFFALLLIVIRYHMQTTQTEPSG